MKRVWLYRGIIICSMCTILLTIPAVASDMSHEVRLALEKGIRYFHSINIHGGYVYYYSLDMSEKWGEGRTGDNTIEVQPPGTPAVGLTFLRAYRVTGHPDFLAAARDAAFALIRGQNGLGGWEHTINFDLPKRGRVSFDDDQTQTAIELLMELDREIDDDSLSASVTRALEMMLEAQLPNGGWPHKYPPDGSYHDYATFNDEGINDCIRVMMKARDYYQKPEFLSSLRKAGRFLMISQLPPPQPGWAQQYNEYLQPAWARSFEPPSVCPSVTVRNLHTLMDLYEFLGRSEYLEPIPDAIRWLDDIRLANGKWARFVELGTNKALYYDRGRFRVDSMEELHIERRTGYGYETDISAALEAARERFCTILNCREQKEPLNKQAEKIPPEQKLGELEPIVKKILETQDDQGRWITKNDRYKDYKPGVRWNGQYAVQDRISSAVFIRNVNTLCQYLELLNCMEDK